VCTAVISNHINGGFLVIKKLPGAVIEINPVHFFALEHYNGDDSKGTLVLIAGLSCFFSGADLEHCISPFDCIALALPAPLVMRD
jgi:hypothetical protein